MCVISQDKTTAIVDVLAFVALSSSRAHIRLADGDTRSGAPSIQAGTGHGRTGTRVAEPAPVSVLFHLPLFHRCRKCLQIVGMLLNVQVE
jgi:hypothetical protein